MLVFFLFLTNCLAAYAVPSKKQIRLRIADNQTSIYDETNIYLDLGTTPDYIFPEDGQKLIDTSLSAPQIFSFSTDNVPCFSNSYGSFTQAVVIPIGYNVQGGSDYTFSASLLDNFDVTSLILLEDRTMGAFIDLRVNAYYINVVQQELNSNRFFLHISKPVSIATVTAGCTNNDGAINIQQDAGVVWNSVILFDDSLNNINSLGNVSGNISFTNLAEGNYKVVFAYNTYTAIVDAEVTGNQISVSIAPSVFQAAPYQTIIFTANTTHTNSYDWDMGDQSYITGVASPDYYYTNRGIYQVVVKCSNSFGCEESDTVTIVIDEALNVTKTEANAFSVLVENKTLQLFSKGVITENIVVEIFTATGQSLSKLPVTGSLTYIPLQSLSAGIYFLKINSGEKVTTRSFFLR